MRDYYYILGISKDASNEEIKRAYRKLSLKFHPDKNDGDEFFIERFKDIQEAYETLSDSQRRTRYDHQFASSSQSGTRNNGHNFEPVILYFETNKSGFEYEEEITFNWKTINADNVVIKPFGSVQPIGQKTFRFKNFKNAELTFELVAENTNIGRLTRKSISLSNKTFQELYIYFKQIIALENSGPKRKTNTGSAHRKSTHDIEYSVLGESKRYDIAWGSFLSYDIKFVDGLAGEIYKGGNSNKYFYFDLTFGKKYCESMEDAIYKLFLHLKNKGTF